MIGLLLTSCASNPARHLAPSAVDPVVRASERRSDKPYELVRGEEKVDEQDFYELVQDGASFDQVKSKRSAGSFFQGLGLTMIPIGAVSLAAGVAAWVLPKGGILGDSGPLPQIFPDSLNFMPYVLAAVGLSFIGLGWWSYQDGVKDTTGAEFVFDQKHAQTSLEAFLYGPNGVQPDSVKTLELTSSDQSPPTFCSTGSTDVKFVARDQRGRPIEIGRERRGWFEWSTEPANLLFDVSAPDTRGISSPLAHSLETFGQDPSVTVSVRATGLRQSTRVMTRFDCSPSISRAGRPGARGDSGQSGSDRGGFGGEGAMGGDGESGPNVTVEAATVVAPSGEKMVLVAVETEGSTQYAVFKSGGSISVSAEGGAGGEGGTGGRGGHGYSASGKCADGGDGGQGGRGGPGGRGGDGGAVSVRLADRSLSSYVQVSAPGGSPGEGGSGGNGGSGGSAGGYYCPKGVHTKSGRSGRSGPDGPNGTRGRSGRVDVSVVPAGSLSLITRALSTNPGFTFDGLGRDAPKRTEVIKSDAPLNGEVGPASDAPAPAPSEAPKPKKKKRR